MKTHEEEEFPAGLGSKRGCKNPYLTKRRLSMTLATIKEEEEEEPNLGASAMSVITDVPKVTTASGLEMMSKKLPSTVGKANADIKRALINEFEKFGQTSEYEGIYKLLEGIQESVDVKKEMVEFAIKEAARLKRRHLIQQLEKILEEMQSLHLFKDKQTPNI